MNIDRVILGLNNNKTYTGFWNPISYIWKTQYNITPTLMFVGTEKQIKENNLSNKYGDIIVLPIINEVVVNPNRDWSTTWAFFYGTTLFSDDICMICGIDQCPLSNIFKDLVEEYADDKYVVTFSDAYLTGVTFPSSHHVAKGALFKEILEIDDDWELELKKIFSLKHTYDLPDNDFWCLDEVHSSAMLKKSSNPNIIFAQKFLHQWTEFKIDRSGRSIDYNLNKLKSGYYSEIHMPRPYELNKPYIDKLIENLLNE